MSDKYRYRVEIQQMMFVSGETSDPPLETTCLVEDIVRSQVTEILLQSSTQAAMRGSKSIATEDVMFLMRHDKSKINRLRTYLSWKDVRKNAKDQEGGGMEGVELLEDAGNPATGLPGPAGVGGPNPSEGTKMMKYKKAKVRLPWELQFMFSEIPLETGNEEEENEDTEDIEAIYASLQLLKTNDERTRGMTTEEYVHWSECRQASFTFRKAKRFREWVGMSQVTESRPQDDVIDILGFLMFELVRKITEEALKVKELEEQIEKKNAVPGGAAAVTVRKRKRHLFVTPDDAPRPMLPRHVQEAYRRLHRVKTGKQALRNFTGGLVRVRTNIM